MTIGKMKRLMAEGSLRAINAWLTEGAAYNHIKPQTSVAIAAAAEELRPPIGEQGR